MIEKERDYWAMDQPPDVDAATNPDWYALVSEKAGGIIAVGRRDIIVTLADLLETASES